MEFIICLPMEIVLIRHGEKIKIPHYNPENKRNDPPLTDRGVKQANLTGHFLKTQNIQKIYSSDMVRTIETTEQISTEINLPYTLQPELREIYFGDLEIEGWESFTTIAPEIFKVYSQRNTDFNYPKGESGEEAFQRTQSLIDQIIHEENQKVAIIAHGGIIRVLLCGLLNIPSGHRFNIGNPIFNCSLTTLHYNPKQKSFQLHQFNSVSHIPQTLQTG